jgi:hypothetical protein
LIIELHWEMPLEIMEVHEFWHPGWRTPSKQTYVMVDTTGPAPFLLGTGQESGGPAKEWKSRLLDSARADHRC